MSGQNFVARFPRQFRTVLCSSLVRGVPRAVPHQSEKSIFLVKGVPITKYCDERRLTPNERLERAGWQQLWDQV
jgi:hypothetical protein